MDRKRSAYKKMLQSNVAGEIREGRRNAYQSWTRKVKELVKESKVRVKEEFGRKQSENFSENMKLFWNG